MSAPSSRLIDAVAKAVEACGASELTRQRVAPHLAVAAKRFEIVTRARLAHWLAQLAHESGTFARLDENLNYSATRLLAVFPARFGTLAMAERYAGRPEALASMIYAGVNGNGVEATGDGYRYRGRGFIQLTGRSNYDRAGKALGLPLIDEPDQAARPDVAALVAGWFWTSRSLNRRADDGDTDAISDLINRGRVTPAKGDAIGYADRAKKLELATGALAPFSDPLEV